MPITPRLQELVEEEWISRLSLFVERVDFDTATKYHCGYSELVCFHPLIGHCRFFYVASDVIRFMYGDPDPMGYMKPMFEHLHKHQTFMEAPGL